MIRRLVLASVFLVIGAALNVPVAWLCVRKLELSRRWPTPEFKFGDSVAERVANIPRLAEEYLSDPKFIPEITDPSVTRFTHRTLLMTGTCYERRNAQSGHSRFAVYRGFGLPFRSLEHYQSWGDGDRPSMQGEWIPQSGPLARLSGGSPDIYPCMIAPLGFTLNTVLYAAVLGAMFTAFSRLPAWRRRRRGQCVSCAYPVTGLAKCPECGRSV